MAGNWIKVRWNLSRDARVLAMAEHVGLPDLDLSARAVSFMLVEVWGLVMEQGERDKEDALLMHANLATLDRVIDTPKFGEAMAQVGWVSSTTFDGKRCLRFPNLLRDNKLVKEQRRDNAERQRKYREKGRDDISDRNALRGVTSNGADKSREDKTNTPPTPQGVRSGGGGGLSKQLIETRAGGLREVFAFLEDATAKRIARLNLNADDVAKMQLAARKFPASADHSALLVNLAKEYAGDNSLPGTLDPPGGSGRGTDRSVEGTSEVGGAA